MPAEVTWRTVVRPRATPVDNGWLHPLPVSACWAATAEGAGLGDGTTGGAVSDAEAVVGTDVFAGAVWVSAEEQAMASQPTARATKKVAGRSMLLSVSGDSGTGDQTDKSGGDSPSIRTSP
ncbi:MAG: hypothetical protein ABI939_01495 [Anaerolineaceae bacterium]